MDIQLVFNELSITPPAVDIYLARQRMENFVGTLVSAVNNGVSRVFRVNTEFYIGILSPGYTIGDWFVDYEVDRDTVRFLKSLSTKYPFWTEIEGGNLEKVLLSEYRITDQIAEGLGTAFLLESLAISFYSDETWNSSSMTLVQETLDENLQPIMEEVVVKHACSIDHVQEHSDWIEQRIITGVADGSDLWSRKEALFPSLIFCENIAKQLESIESGNAVLRQIIKKLMEIEVQASQWEDGQFDIDAIRASPESESTLQRYSNERTFICPDGQARVFSLHARLAPGRWRLHFFPDSENHQVIIGYIGPHLPIVNSHT